MCIQRPNLNDIYGCNACEWVGPAATPRCDECGSANVYLYMRAPNRAELAVMHAKSVEDIDPDWRDHFHDEDRAREFYGLQGSVGK